MGINENRKTRALEELRTALNELDECRLDLTAMLALVVVDGDIDYTNLDNLRGQMDAKLDTIQCRTFSATDTIGRIGGYT